MNKLPFLIGLVMAMALALPSNANAATFTVDSTADAPDANPGDGVCDDGAGNCTLRAAIEEANALVGADTITFPAGTYTLTGGEFDITDDLTITGAGPATTFVDGGLLARVILISSVTVDISGVTIQNGATGSLGGGIFNGGTLELTNVTVSGNSALGGGGIANFGTMELTDVTVSGNSAGRFGGGGIANFGTTELTDVTVNGNLTTGGDGGGIYNSGTMTLTSVTVSGNSATGAFAAGGGIANRGGGTMTLTGGTVSGNSATAGPDFFGGNGGGIFNGGTMELTDVTVSGNSASDGGGGVLNDGGGSLTLTNVTVSDNSASDEGGGIGNFGGSTLTLNNVTVSDNTARRGGGLFIHGGTLTFTNVAVSGNSASDEGGGILNAGTMTLTNVTVSGNSASDGGGIFNDGTMGLNNATVSINSAIAGGGIFNNGGGSLTLTNVTVSDNSASASGGGIENLDMLTLTDVTVSGNSAAAHGGGIKNFGAVVELTNVTVSHNSAAEGGGIFNSLNTMTLTNVTVSSNSAIAGGGIVNFDNLTLTNATVSGNSASALGGGILNAADAVLNNSIIASNTPQNCAGTSVITSEGHNLENADGCAFTAPSDLTHTDPLLGSLQDNGGPTETHALLPGSPAIDAGSGDCPPPTTDQRGVARPQGTACDIGAYESCPLAGCITPTPTPTPTPTATPTPTPTPTPVPPQPCDPLTPSGSLLPGMSLGGPGTVARGVPFSICVNADPAPNIEISGSSSEVLFPAGLKWLPRPNCRGPGPNGEVQVERQDGGPIAICLSGFTTLLGGAGHTALTEAAIPPLEPLNVTPGSTTMLVELDFVCNTEGSYKLTLTAVPDSPFGAVYQDLNAVPILLKTVPHDYDGDTVPNQVADTLVINCVEPSVGGLMVDLDEDLGGLLAATARSSGPSTTVLTSLAGAVVAGSLALGGAAWYARRRRVR